MPKRRSLTEANAKILKRSHILQETISELVATRPEVRVLEVGFGRGLAMAELAWMYRAASVRFFGIEKKTRDSIRCAADILREAACRGLVPEDATRQIAPPVIESYDAKDLRFPDHTMDLIYTVMVVRFMEHKARFLEEVCRVLKPGGIGLIQIGESHWKYPCGPASDDLALTPALNRFVLMHRRELIPLEHYLKFFGHDAFHFQFINLPRCVLRIKKRTEGKLDLKLTLDRELTVSMRSLPVRHRHGKVRGGIRTVYQVADEIYQAMCESEMINSTRLH